MAFRSSNMLRKVAKYIRQENLNPVVKDLVKTHHKNSKVVMGRAQRGIFGGKHIQFGDVISEDGGNRSKRSWKPNIQEKRLFSYIHNDHIRLKVSTYVLKCIDKAGGIDEYLLQTPYKKLESKKGLFWKTKIEKMYGKLEELEATAGGINLIHGAKLTKKKSGTVSLEGEKETSTEKLEETSAVLATNEANEKKTGEEKLKDIPVNVKKEEQIEQTNGANLNEKESGKEELAETSVEDKK